MVAKQKKPAETGQGLEIDILKVTYGEFTVCILGRTPLIYNRVNEKVKRTLLLPSGKKSAAEKAMTLKHNPPEEFRASVYRTSEDDAPTRLVFPTLAFKGAIRSVATDMPGAAKAQIGRLTYVVGDYVSVYGIPKLKMDVTRSADVSHTPDVRTRAILPQWTCLLTVRYVSPLLREPAVVNLLAAAGMMRGVGDWRVEKGAGSFGQFELVTPDHPRVINLMKTSGMAAQDAALESPEAYDTETLDLLDWYEQEVTRRVGRQEVKA